MPAAMAPATVIAARSSPSTRIGPALGAATPPRIFISVDLPAPFSPTRPITSPGCDGQAHVVERDDAGIGLADVRGARETALPCLHLWAPADAGASGGRRRGGARAGAPLQLAAEAIFAFRSASNASTFALSMTLVGTMISPSAGTIDLSPSRYAAISFMPW